MDDGFIEMAYRKRRGGGKRKKRTNNNNNNKKTKKREVGRRMEHIWEKLERLGGSRDNLYTLYLCVALPKNTFKIKIKLKITFRPEYP